VAEIEICWPLGLPPDAGAPALCQRRMKAWTLDGATPPTFAERDARLWNAGVETFDADARSGLRLSAECSGPHARETRQIARWPALASPWLGAQPGAQSRLPPLGPDCVADGRCARRGLVSRAPQDSPRKGRHARPPLRRSSKNSNWAPSFPS
jgi:penicillin-binding protein 1C